MEQQQHTWWTQQHNSMDGGPNQAAGASNVSLHPDQEAKDARGRQGRGRRRQRPFANLHAQRRTPRPQANAMLHAAKSTRWHATRPYLSSRGHHLRRRQKSSEPAPPRTDPSCPDPFRRFPHRFPANTSRIPAKKGRILPPYHLNTPAAELLGSAANGNL